MISMALLKQIVIKFPILLLIVIHLAFFSSGCRMATGPRFRLVESCPPGKAVVYVYRPYISRSKTTDEGLPDLYLDGERIVPMSNGGYIDMYLEPGNHTFEIKKSIFGLTPGRTMERIDLDLQAGKEYYLAFEQNLGDIDPAFFIDLGLELAAGVSSSTSFRRVSRMFSPVPKEMALPELQRTRSLRPREN